MGGRVLTVWTSLAYLLRERCMRKLVVAISLVVLFTLPVLAVFLNVSPSDAHDPGVAKLALQAGQPPITVDCRSGPVSVFCADASAFPTDPPRDSDVLPPSPTCALSHHVCVLTRAHRVRCGRPIWASRHRWP